MAMVMSEDDFQDLWRQVWESKKKTTLDVAKLSQWIWRQQGFVPPRSLVRNSKRIKREAKMIQDQKRIGPKPFKASRMLRRC